MKKHFSFLKNLFLYSFFLLCFFQKISYPNIPHGTFPGTSCWNQILQNHTRGPAYQTGVRYQALKKKQTSFQNCLHQFSSVSQKTWKQFSKKDQIAFLINTYNAFTVALILKHYPTNSIKDFGIPLFYNPWKDHFFKLFGKKSYLDFIEHEILRKKFQEPRIHFALVCAARGCPPLRKEAYTGTRLDLQLQDQMQLFLSDKQKNYYDSKKKILFISKIFNWYREDFVKKYHSLEAFLAKFFPGPPSLKQAIKKNTIPIRFTPYDWRLNDQTNTSASK